MAKRKPTPSDPLGTKHLRKIVRMLRKDFPTNAPIRVERPAWFKLGYHGDTNKGTKGYLIRLNRYEPCAMQIDTLLHEWAHALTWSRKDEPHHSMRWAERYAALTRWVQSEDEWEGTSGETPPEERYQ